MRISIQKGGASVIANGMLINGEMTASQYQFCVEYGYLLQIIDDIQDQEEDSVASHHTLASILTKKQERSALSNQLLHYIQDVVWHRFPVQRAHIQACIASNCTQLLITSVLKNPTWYPALYIRQLKQYLPFHESILNEFENEICNLDKEQFMQDIGKYIADID